MFLMSERVVPIIVFLETSKASGSPASRGPGRGRASLLTAGLLASLLPSAAGRGLAGSRAGYAHGSASSHVQVLTADLSCVDEHVVGHLLVSKKV